MIKLKKIKNTIPDFDAADENTYYNAMNTAPHTPNDTTAPDAENTMSARQLLDGQGYHVAKDDIIQKYFDCKADVEQCMAYLHGLYQLTDCPRYTGDRIIPCTCLQLLHMDNNAMSGAVQFMVYFQGMHFNVKKALYINFQKYAPIFVRQC